MNLFKKTCLVSTLALLSSGAFAAEKQEIDPSDLTKTNTAAYVGINSQGDIKLNGSLSFGLSNGQKAMTTLEGTMDNEGNYSDSRLQYFHVFNVNSPVVPRVAASLDIIDNNQFTTAAIGSIALFQTPIKEFNIFARVGALAGEYDSDFAASMGASDTSITGGMAATYFVWKPGADGTYFALYPEFTYLDGDIETSTVKTTLMAATPLSADKTRWGQFKIENTSGTMESARHKIEINDTVGWFLYKVFF